MFNATLYSIYDFKKFIFNNKLNINNGGNNYNDKLYMSDTNMPSLNNSTHLSKYICETKQQHLYNTGYKSIIIIFILCCKKRDCHKNEQLILKVRIQILF